MYYLTKLQPEIKLFQNKERQFTKADIKRLKILKQIKGKKTSTERKIENILNSLRGKEKTEGNNDDKIQKPK